MIGHRSIKDLLPYLVVFGVALYFYYLADRFEYVATPGRMGPDGWPKIVIGLLGLVCIWEIGRRVLTAVRSGATVWDASSASTKSRGPAEVEEVNHPRSVAAAVVATVCYLLVLEIVGFAIATLLYMTILMWVGGFRRLLIVVPLSAIGSILFLFLFMKIIFVALPIGIEPFSRISLALMSAIGIH